MRGATECMPLEPWLVWLYGMCGEYTARDHYLCCGHQRHRNVAKRLHGLAGPLLAWRPVDARGFGRGHAGQQGRGIRATLAPMYDDHDFVLDAADALGHDLRGSVYGLAHGGYRADRDDFRRGVLKDNLAIV